MFASTTLDRVAARTAGVPAVSFFQAVSVTRFA
jgi:hypothetical protein